MKPRYTPFEAARRILTISFFTLGGEQGRRFMTFALARADTDDYLREVKRIVDVELPFWEILCE